MCIQKIFLKEEQVVRTLHHIPFEKRWSSRHFKLDEIFKNDIINVDNKKEVSWYYDLDGWENLVSFYKSKHYDGYQPISIEAITGHKLNRLKKEEK